MRIPCIHGREKYYCRDCGGLSFCIHNKNRKNCRECHGSSLCIHNKQKYGCKDCGGKGTLEETRKRRFCVHGKRKYYCRDCGGGGFCIHDQYKSLCKVCKVFITEDKFYKSLTKCIEKRQAEAFNYIFYNYLKNNIQNDGKDSTKPIINYLKDIDIENKEVCVHGNSKECSECFVSSLLK